MQRAPGPSRIVEGEPYPLEIRASGAALPPPGGKLDDPVLERPVAIGPRWRGRHHARPRLLGRGRRALGPTTLEVGDPLGIWRRRLEGPAGGELLVLPRIEPVLAGGSGAGGSRRGASAVDDAAAASRSDLRAIELEVDGLRPYREGMPASRIHWPAVARTGELVERRLTAGSDTAPLVVCDASRPDSAEALDAAVRAAASLCVHLAALGGCSLLIGGSRRPFEIDADLHSWPQAHARLALVEPASAQPLISGLRSGAIFWVAGRSAARLPEALRATPSPRYVVVPGAFADATFTVAGCSGRRSGARRRTPRRAAA